MSTTEGRLDCVNVVELSFTDNGKSLRIEVRASIPPYKTTIITLRNAFSVRLTQSPDDEYPYFIPEIRWRPIAKVDNADVLRQAQYDFFDEHRKPLIVDRHLLLLQLEGAVCGQIIAEAIECE